MNAKRPFIMLMKNVNKAKERSRRRRQMDKVAVRWLEAEMRRK